MFSINYGNIETLLKYTISNKIVVQFSIGLKILKLFLKSSAEFSSSSNNFLKLFKRSQFLTKKYYLFTNNNKYKNVTKFSLYRKN